VAQALLNSSHINKSRLQYDVAKEVLQEKTKPSRTSRHSSRLPRWLRSELDKRRGAVKPAPLLTGLAIYFGLNGLPRLFRLWPRWKAAWGIPVQDQRQTFSANQIWVRRSHCCGLDLKNSQIVSLCWNRALGRDNCPKLLSLQFLEEHTDGLTPCCVLCPRNRLRTLSICSPQERLHSKWRYFRWGIAYGVRNLRTAETHPNGLKRTSSETFLILLSRRSLMSLSNSHHRFGSFPRRRFRCRCAKADPDSASLARW